MINPDRLYAAVMWLISLVFASFLLGLGGLVIKDLPQVSDYTQVAEIQLETPQERARKDELQAKISAATSLQQQTQRDYQEAEQVHKNWLAQRAVTSSSASAPAQDPELLRRTRELDARQQSRESARHELNRLQAEYAALGKATHSRYQQDLSSPEYQAQKRKAELTVFGLRLALTLPLLAAAGWLIARKRKSPYWPLARGFVIFAVLTFFSELVPYLPSYGGYVRYAVGILVCLAGSHFLIKHMQRLLEHRRAQAQQAEALRRLTLNTDQAIKRLESGLCPGCQRPVVKSLGSEQVNHCGHCGLHLFDVCHAPLPFDEQEGKPQAYCLVRKNAFYAYCPSCGAASKGATAESD